jgi:hypothetical protein
MAQVRKRGARQGTKRVARAAPAHRNANRMERGVRTTITAGEIITTGVVNLVRTTLVSSVAGVRDVGGEIGVTAISAVRSAIRAGTEIGGDLDAVVKQALKGTVQATTQIGGDVGSVVHAAARGAVRTAEQLGGNVGTVARRAVEGTVEAAREIGGDVMSLAQNAAEGAVEAADRISTAAGRTVRDTLSGSIAGIRGPAREVAEGRGRSAAPHLKRQRVVGTIRRRGAARARASRRKGTTQRPASSSRES